MTLRDEIRQFMVVSETLLDGTIHEADLTYIELELLLYYLSRVGQKFSAHPKLTHSSMQNHADITLDSSPRGALPRGE
jgi:hypothetical protein